MSGLELLALISTLLGGIGGATIYIVSAVRKTRTDELSELANTRGERIHDLEAHVIRLEQRIAKLEGQYEALQNLKIDQIANAVVAKLIGEDADFS